MRTTEQRDPELIKSVTIRAAAEPWQTGPSKPRPALRMGGWDELESDWVQ